MGNLFALWCESVLVPRPGVLAICVTGTVILRGGSYMYNQSRNLQFGRT